MVKVNAAVSSAAVFASPSAAVQVKVCAVKVAVGLPVMVRPVGVVGQAGGQAGVRV